jgi:predicted ArsR family transcriptional regulator
MATRTKQWRKITPLQSDVYNTVKFYGSVSLTTVAEALNRPKSQIRVILDALVERELLTYTAYGYSVRPTMLY